MKIVIQRVLDASVSVEGECVGAIEHGLVLLVGLEEGDSEKDLEVASLKISKLRIFDDEDGIMNKSVLDVGGSILSISQFTLAADLRKGNRPSYIQALKPECANEYYEKFNESLRKCGLSVETGIFQAHMNVVLNNDGPVTLIMNVKDGKVS